MPKNTPKSVIEEETVPALTPEIGVQASDDIPDAQEPTTISKSDDRSLLDQLQVALNIVVAMRCHGIQLAQIKTKIDIIKAVMSAARFENWTNEKIVSSMTDICGKPVMESILLLQRDIGCNYIPYRSVWHQLKLLNEIIDKLVNGEESLFLPKEITNEFKTRLAKLSGQLSLSEKPASKTNLEKLVTSKFKK
jgi:hypothetical protein